MNRILNHISGTRLNLKRNNQFQFALKHALHIYIPNSIYTFIPKNACSTMRYTVARANGFIDKESDINWIHENNATFNPDLRSLITADYAFVIMRCPYSRLASVFLDKFVMQTPDSFKYYTDMNRRINPLDLTFRQFVNSLNTNPILKSNIHWRPQVEFLVYQDYDDYFAIEDFNTIENTLEKKIKLKVFDARKLTKHGVDGMETVKEGSNNSDMSIFELIELKRKNRIVPPTTLYDEKIYSDVTSIYSADIAFYVSKFGKEGLLKLK